LLEQLTRKFDITKSTGSDEVPVTNGRSVHILVGVSVPGDVRTQVIEAVAGVASAA
jgi:hypothetical protein